MTNSVSAVFAKVCELGIALGKRDLNQLPACWDHDLGDGWAFSLNAHDTPKPDDRGASVPPFTVAVMWNGWPAGLVDPSGGVIAAGDAANESALLASLDAAIEKAKSEDPNQLRLPVVA
jgi:hypothetical protein